MPMSTKPAMVAMVPTVSMAQAQVLSALDYGDGRDTIVMSELDFPSVRYVYDSLATRLGARIVVVPSDDGVGVSEDRLIEAIDERTKDGAFVFRDPKLNADLHLVFDEIKIVRGMEGYGWFPNVNFHDKDEPKKKYAIDFWFKPEGQELKLMDIRVRGAPKQEGDSWVMITRSPQAWWWLPAGEHPGDMEVTRAWQVMSAIHGYIATHKEKDGNLPIKDDKTGETMPLEFVEIHQPVRHLKNEGKYFVCTDFRKPGSKDEYYDIDFWVNQKSGKLEVDNVKIHKVPVQEDGIWTQQRYTFEGMDFETTH